MSQSQPPASPELLGFLQTLVNQGEGQGTASPERTDSDKENEIRIGVTPEADPVHDENSRPLPLEKTIHPLPSEDGRSMNRRSSGNNYMWDDFDNEEESKAMNVENNYRPSSALGSIRDKEHTTLEMDRDEEAGLEEMLEEDEDDLSKSLVTTEEKTENIADREMKYEGGTSSPSSSCKKKITRNITKIRGPRSGHAPITAQVGSNPELVRQNRESHRSQFETMSETSGRIHGRQLSRRKQESRPRCAGPAQNCDQLTQKYEELQHLIIHPIIVSNTGTIAQSRAQLKRLKGLNQQYHTQTNQVSTLPPTGSHQERKPHRQAFIELGGDYTEQGYTTLRTVQVANHFNGKTTHLNNRCGTRPKTAHSANNRRPASGPRQGRSLSADDHNADNSRRPRSRTRVKRRTMSSESNERNSVRNSMRSDTNSHKDDNEGKHDFESETTTDNHSEVQEKKRSGSTSHERAAQENAMHLKHSNNPALRKWLKAKNKELRRKNAEERRQRWDEQKKAKEDEQRKQELFEESEEKVKGWMKMKRKEALKQTKEDRTRQRDEEAARYEQEQQRDPSKILNANGITMTQSAENGQHITKVPTAGFEAISPRPPSSKFVYKRPASGRLRLMKLQQEQKTDANRTEHEKREMEKRLAEQKAQKMRISYDQWLVKKRGEDYARRQEAARLNAMIRSDVELERTVPDVARWRIGDIQRGKGRIHTGLQLDDQELNSSFGGEDFGADTVSDEECGAARLRISGSQKSLRQRPASAGPATEGGGVPYPRISKSPRRPKSANPRVQVFMGGKENETQSRTFRLPFPSDMGVPKHVNDRQKKLFSTHVTQGSSSQVREVATSQENNAASANVELSQSVALDQSKESQQENEEEKDHISEAAAFDLNDPGTGEHADATVAKENEEDDNSFFVTQGVEKEKREENNEEIHKVEQVKEEEDFATDAQKEVENNQESNLTELIVATDEVTEDDSQNLTKSDEQHGTFSENANVERVESKEQQDEQKEDIVQTDKSELILNINDSDDESVQFEVEKLKQELPDDVVNTNDDKDNDSSYNDEAEDERGDSIKSVDTPRDIDDDYF